MVKILCVEVESAILLQRAYEWFLNLAFGKSIAADALL